MHPKDRSEQLFLLDIREAIERIRNSTKGGKSEFYDSDVIQDAVVKNLLVIGEAARRLGGILDEW